MNRTTLQPSVVVGVAARLEVAHALSSNINKGMNKTKGK